MSDLLSIYHAFFVLYLLLLLLHTWQTYLLQLLDDTLLLIQTNNNPGRGGILPARLDPFEHLRSDHIMVTLIPRSSLAARDTRSSVTYKVDWTLYTMCVISKKKKTINARHEERKGATTRSLIVHQAYLVPRKQHNIYYTNSCWPCWSIAKLSLLVSREYAGENPTRPPQPKQHTLLSLLSPLLYKRGVLSRWRVCALGTGDVTRLSLSLLLCI